MVYMCVFQCVSVCVCVGCIVYTSYGMLMFGSRNVQLAYMTKRRTRLGLLSVFLFS